MNKVFTESTATSKEGLLKIKSAVFETSAVTFDDVRAHTKNLPQIAFAGRSNVGKSSLINMLCEKKNLAVTSSTPGRTRLINFFKINDVFYFVDLPGYGFAAAGKNTQGGWNESVGGYLTKAKNLRLVFVVLDVRISPTDKDLLCLNFLQSNEIPFAILGSKADKLNRSDAAAAGRKLAATIGVGENDIIITSSFNKKGKDKILQKVLNVI